MDLIAEIMGKLDIEVPQIPDSIEYQEVNKASHDKSDGEIIQIEDFNDEHEQFDFLNHEKSVEGSS